MRTFSPDEYLAIERAAADKSEYVGGRIYNMSGGSLNHSRICVEVTGILREALRGTGCEVVNSDMKVRTPSNSMFTYPDATVICDQPIFHDEKRDVITNPIVIVEALSPSTEDYDRGHKFLLYQQIPSLRCYVIVYQSEPRIDVFVRADDGHWDQAISRGVDAAAQIPAIGCTLPLSEVYRRIEFTASGA
jgi:Uma2 family endonuclease